MLSHAKEAVAGAALTEAACIEKGHPNPAAALKLHIFPQKGP